LRRWRRRWFGWRRSRDFGRRWGCGFDSGPAKDAVDPSGVRRKLTAMAIRLHHGKGNDGNQHDQQ
jgi:hypothetical protein